MEPEAASWQSAISFPCYSRLQVEEILNKIEMLDHQEESINNSAHNGNKKGHFYSIPCMPIAEQMHPFICNIQNLNRWYFGYDVDWAIHLDRYSVNNYEEGNGQYDWHHDYAHTSPKFDIKLTCLLNLSLEPFDGGILEIAGLEEPPKFDTGMGIVINSLVSHRVTPVTKGKRITLTYFATGAPWR